MPGTWYTVHRIGRTGGSISPNGTTFGNLRDSTRLTRSLPTRATRLPGDGGRCEPGTDQPLHVQQRYGDPQYLGDIQRDHLTINGIGRGERLDQPERGGTVNYGAGKTFTIAPDTDFGVNAVLVDGGSVGAVTSYTFSSVTANHTISATFKLTGRRYGANTRSVLNDPAANKLVRTWGRVLTIDSLNHEFTMADGYGVPLTVDFGLAILPSGFDINTMAVVTGRVTRGGVTAYIIEAY